MATAPPNRAFNERPSPPVQNHKLQALQILCNLRRNNPIALNTVLSDLGFDDGDFAEACETLYQELLEDGTLVDDCGCCGGAHRKDFGGECRNDDERFPSW
jgi:hypothetical protein